MSGYCRKQLRLTFFILVLATGLFFYPLPLFGYDFGIGQEQSKVEETIEIFLQDSNIFDKKTEKWKGINPEVFDPLQKIGLSSFKKEPAPAAYSDSELAEEKKEGEDTLRYREILKSTPMEAMAVEIGKKDKKVAAFLIGIGKKESSWGKHSPKDHGKECYNYWGYRGKENTTESGYSCFDSPEHAVTVVGGKIEKLIGQKIDTPERMIVWKCGRTCAGHDPAGVRKWISDVSKYYYALKS